MYGFGSKKNYSKYLIMGIFDKFKLGLNRSSKSFSSGLNNLMFKKKIDESMLKEL